jgi:hypothetical protein
MFNPTRDQARLFFLNSWKKYHLEQPLSEAESLALLWMTRHPEYFPVFDEDPERVLSADYSVEQGQSNPFLHLSMHLAVAEQVSIDQPPGIRAAFSKLCEKMGDEHKAAHQVFECLAEQIYQQQRNGVPFSSENYIQCVLEHSGL